MRVRITPDLSGLENLQRGLRPSELRDLMANIGEEAVGLAQATFQDRTDPYGEQWAPLATATLNSIVPGTNKRRREYGSRPLMRFGLLRNSLNARVAPSGRTVAVGSPLPYAKFHQGDPFRRARRVPRRRFLPDPGDTPTAWRIEFLEAAQAYIDSLDVGIE